jgi:hypothetical protein
MLLNQAAKIRFFIGLSQALRYFASTRLPGVKRLLDRQEGVVFARGLAPKTHFLFCGFPGDRARSAVFSGKVCF